MKKRVFLLSLVALVALTGVFLWWYGNKDTKENVVIITTAFPEYDAVRAVTGEVPKILLKPGSELHDFEPTPKDVIDIKEADFVLYGGGESEAWLDELLIKNDIDEGKLLSLLDIIEPDMNGDEEDEHVWTSPLNMIEIIEAVRDSLSEIWPNRAKEFEANADKYIAELKAIDEDLRDTVNDGRVRTLVFADRFPFYYFAKEYGLDYLAAFPGCAEQTEADSKTVAELINKIKADKLGAILKIELSDGKLADVIAGETGTKVLELNSAHNVSRDDFENGVTYVDIMRRNIAVLREALK